MEKFLYASGKVLAEPEGFSEVLFGGGEPDFEWLEIDLEPEVLQHIVSNLDSHRVPAIRAEGRGGFPLPADNRKFFEKIPHVKLLAASHGRYADDEPAFILRPVSHPLSQTPGDGL